MRRLVAMLTPMLLLVAGAVPSGTGAAAAAVAVSLGAGDLQPHPHTYRVRPGDNLTRIASRHGSSIDALMSANGLSDPDFVMIGTSLTIPEGGRSGGGSSGGGRHTVRFGETLSGIAARHAVSVESLRAANGIADPNLVFAGATITVPAGSTVRTAGSVGVPSSRQGLRPLFTKHAATYGVPADLTMALAWQESGWQTSRVSSTGAVGVMQLMPDTVDFVSRVLLRRSSNLNPYDPDQNIQMGTRFVRYLLDQTGDTRLALASYYQGLASVRSRGLLQETERFVANVVALRKRF